MVEQVRAPLLAAVALVVFCIAVRAPPSRVGHTVDVSTSYRTVPYVCPSIWCVPPTPLVHPVHIRVVVVY